ncbi:hypothetical protein C7M39_03066 (plasmid) [Lactiplantibacillus plantarum]|nr:hypothetical protein C7M39_03066 [Lactiplantibacillus plantarum]
MAQGFRNYINNTVRQITSLIRTSPTNLIIAAKKAKAQKSTEASNNMFQKQT